MRKSDESLSVASCVAMSGCNSDDSYVLTSCSEDSEFKFLVQKEKEPLKEGQSDDTRSHEREVVCSDGCALHGNDSSLCIDEQRSSGPWIKFHGVATWPSSAFDVKTSVVSRLWCNKLCSHSVCPLAGLSTCEAIQ